MMNILFLGLSLLIVPAWAQSQPSQAIEVVKASLWYEGLEYRFDPFESDSVKNATSNSDTRVAAIEVWLSVHDAFPSTFQGLPQTHP